MNDIPDKLENLDMAKWKVNSGLCLLDIDKLSKLEYEDMAKFMRTRTLEFCATRTALITMSTRG